MVRITVRTTILIENNDVIYMYLKRLTCDWSHGNTCKSNLQKYYILTIEFERIFPIRRVSFLERTVLKSWKPFQWKKNPEKHRKDRMVMCGCTFTVHVSSMPSKSGSQGGLRKSKRIVWSTYWRLRWSAGSQGEAYVYATLNDLNTPLSTLTLGWA